MSDKEFNAFIREDARKHNMCDKVYNSWKEGYDKQDMITLWKNNFDFALENNYPSVEFIKENFSKSLLAKNNIYVDNENMNLLLDNGMYIFNGKCEGSLTQDSFRCTNIYVRHDCNLDIKVGFIGDMHIHVYDNAFVRVNKSSGARVYVYLDGGSAEVSKGVIVRDRREK